MKKHIALFITFIFIASLVLSSCAAKTACSSKSKKGQGKKVQKFMGYKK